MGPLDQQARRRRARPHGQREIKEIARMSQAANGTAGTNKQDTGSFADSVSRFRIVCSEGAAWCVTKRQYQRRRG